MRAITVSLFTLGITLLPVAASAKAKPRVAAESQPTESAAARSARLAMAEDTGALRDASDLKGSVINVSISKIATPDATGPERKPDDAVDTVVRPAGPLSGALEDLVAKQVARNENAFGRCVAEARTRDPQLAGTIELAVTVAARHVSAQVVSGTTDPAFGSCVAQVAGGLKLLLPDLAFPWKLAVGRAAVPTATSAASAALP